MIVGYHSVGENLYAFAAFVDKIHFSLLPSQDVKPGRFTAFTLSLMSTPLEVQVLQVTRCVSVSVREKELSKRAAARFVKNILRLIIKLSYAYCKIDLR